MPVPDLTVDEVMKAIETITQSDQTIPIGETFEIHLRIARIPIGSQSEKARNPQVV